MSYPYHNEKAGYEPEEFNKRRVEKMKTLADLNCKECGKPIEEREFVVTMKEGKPIAYRHELCAQAKKN